MHKTIVTHSGIFHADDVFAVATALLVYPDAEIIRTRDPEVIKRGDIVVDVGGVYDPLYLRFDHHQPGGGGVRGNGVPYASFGLIWKEFGKWITSNEAAEIIDEKLVMPIDAPDNGVSIYNHVYENIKPYTITDFIYSFLSYEEEGEDYLYNVFKKIVRVARKTLIREIAKAEERVDGMTKVRNLLDSLVDKRVVILEDQLPWEKVLVPANEPLFVIYPRREGNWAVKAIPVVISGFERKKYFPESWAGKDGQELVEITGVPDAGFCHRGRFFATAATKEGATILAQKALEF